MGALLDFLAIVSVLLRKIALDLVTIRILVVRLVCGADAGRRKLRLYGQ